MINPIAFPSPTPGIPSVILAPMEGVTDAPMRALMTERGGFSFCVSEFIRISQEVPPHRTFRDWVPELSNPGCRTPSGTPVQIQILGGNAEKMAASAIRGVEAGAQAIDINFGCPAPTVNRNDGGASILRYPTRVRDIVQAVRDALPAHIPVSAKLRLGWEHPSDIFENATMAAQGGAAWITIHARTKMQGYRPPVDWKSIGLIRERLDIPVVANGDIWNFQDFLRCREETGCEHFMLGRGALANPSLASEVSRHLQSSPIQNRVPIPWKDLVLRFAELSRPFAHHDGYTLRRIKQWAKLASLHRTLPWFDSIKRIENLEQALALIPNE